MNEKEFRFWMAETESSRFEWVLDQIALHNRGEVLIYRGGVDGQFILVDRTGLVTIGRYEDALPHIGEAMMTITSTVRKKSFDEALARIIELGGPRLLFQFVTGDRY